MHFSQARTSFLQHFCYCSSQERGCKGLMLFFFTTWLHLEGPFMNIWTYFLTALTQFKDGINPPWDLQFERFPFME